VLYCRFIHTVLPYNTISVFFANQEMLDSGRERSFLAWSETFIYIIHAGITSCHIASHILPKPVHEVMTKQSAEWDMCKNWGPSANWLAIVHSLSTPQRIVQGQGGQSPINISMLAILKQKLKHLISGISIMCYISGNIQSDILSSLGSWSHAWM